MKPKLKSVLNIEVLNRK